MSCLADVACDHYVCWHTRDGVATNLLRKWTPCIHSLTHNTVMLTVHALSSRTLSALAEIDDGMLRSIHSINLNLVVAVLDGGGGHGACRLLCNYRAWERRVDAPCATTSSGVEVTTCPVSVLQQPLTLFNH